MWSQDKRRSTLVRCISGVVMETLEGRLLFSTVAPTVNPDLPNPVVPIKVPTAPLPLQGVVGTPLSLDPAMVDAGYEFNQVGFTAPDGSEVQGNGAGTTIAIVDAFGSPTIVNDLETFDSHWGISNNDASGNFCLTVQPLGGANVTPGAVATNGDWAAETALDVEWAHAVAPGAHILLVEAPDDSMIHLLDSVVYAANQPGVVDVSMSWGDDVSNMTEPALLDGFLVSPSGHLDSNGATGGVTFLAASGDDGQVSYPAASENVLSVGGLSVGVGLNGQIQTIGAWNNTFGSSGGGANIYAPSWQEPYVALTADPLAGVWTYNSTPGTAPGSSAPGWQVVGGTSFACAAWAGLVSIIDQGIMLQTFQDNGQTFHYGSLDSPGMINDILFYGELNPDSFITDWGGTAPTYPLWPTTGPMPDVKVIPGNGNSGFGLPVSETLASNIVQNVTGNAGTFDAQAVAQLAFTQGPTNTEAGQTISPGITVTETGGTLTGSVTISISALSPSQAPVLLGTTTVTAVNGVATFNNLTIDQAGTYELEASSPGIISADSGQFSITSTTPTQLGFITQPTATWQFGPIIPPVVVGMEDQFGNVVTNSTNAVTLSIESGPAGAGISGGGTENASAGQASYDDLVFSKSGDYTLLATSSGLTSAVSDSFAVVGIPATEHFLFNGAALGAILMLQQEHRNATVVASKGPPSQALINAIVAAVPALPAAPAVTSSPIAEPALTPNAAAADAPGPLFSFVPFAASTTDDQLKDLLAN
jgi:hypothetical protein